MVLTPIASVPAGKQANLVFSHLMSEGSFHVGTEIPFGGSVAFELEGSLEGRMTLYDVKKSGNQINGAWLVELNPQYPPLGLSNPEIDDFCYNHDVLCGLGGFSSASSWLAMRTVTAVDWSSLALDAFKLNHQVFCLCEDVSQVATVYSMHLKQLEFGRQPMLTAGTPCQPLSKQGHQKGPDDIRSQTLPAVLRAAHLLGSAGLVLECVPEALNDPSTQCALGDFAAICGYDLFVALAHNLACQAISLVCHVGSQILRFSWFS